MPAAGKDVLVIEKGGYYNEADFTGLEAEMTPQLFLRRGALSTADLGMVVLAGSRLAAAPSSIGAPRCGLRRRCWRSGSASMA